MTERYIDAGAQFIASPFLRPEMGKICHERKILWMPGCTTKSDIAWAKTLGATVIGLLPANILGPEFLQSVKREYPDLQFIPSGIWISIPVCLPNGTKQVTLSETGSSFVPKDAITVKDWG
jgi:2-dehydro-3-deoxyphosphogluconate aldolase/(4S)-4-hydroxy-2-oxoglutarate aldolase